MSYIELHCRSAFSFLRGASTPEQLAERAAQLQMSAMALCDRDGFYGAPRFFSRARELGVRAIVGAELTMEDETILPVLVQSRAGYQNLSQLLTRAHLRNEKGNCRVRWNELPEFANGLVALANRTQLKNWMQLNWGSAPAPGAVRRAPAPNFWRDRQTNGVDDVLRQNAARPGRAPQAAEKFSQSIEKLLEIFGAENVFMELQRHRVRGEEKIIRAQIEIANHLQLPLLATNGVLYCSENERPIRDVFTCLRHHTHLDAAGKLLEPNGERYLKSDAQMRELFFDLPEAIENTARLAERLDFTLENLGYEFPSFPIPAGHSMDSFLREQAFAGAKNRYGKIPEKVRGQLENELALIAKLKVAGYFLIVWDIVKFCREQNIMSQGRGSAANSTVCFCLGITMVDPLKFNTLFERFLTEGRKDSWPDIDIDLPSGDRRERVIQEIYRRYNKTPGSAPASGAADDAFVVGTNVERQSNSSESSARRVWREGAPNASRGDCTPKSFSYGAAIQFLPGCIQARQLKIKLSHWRESHF